jgi:GntR family transcriptional repressor for pyruvate dehydrogenase complex
MTALPELPARRKRFHEVAERLEAMIRSGEVPVGAPLPSERTLMERFGVGRPSIREALFCLQQSGMVEISNGARARVVSPSPSFVLSRFDGLARHFLSAEDGQRHMEQARAFFEVGLARHAAQHATDEDIAGLKRALDANTAAVGNVEAFVRTDVAFHYQLALIPRNPIFPAIHQAMVEWLTDQRTTTINMPDADLLSVRDHTAIYEAVAARAPERAGRVMSDHLKLIAELYAAAKRVQRDIMRRVTHEVAQRLEAERGAPPRRSRRPARSGAGNTGRGR